MLCICLLLPCCLCLLLPSPISFPLLFLPSWLRLDFPSLRFPFSSFPSPFSKSFLLFLFVLADDDCLRSRLFPFYSTLLKKDSVHALVPSSSPSRLALASDGKSHPTLSLLLLASIAFPFINCKHLGFRLLRLAWRPPISFFLFCSSSWSIEFSTIMLLSA